MNPGEKQKHMLATYRSLRYGIVFIGALFPLILLFVGLAKGIDWQDSMSAYYHAVSNGHSMRDWFVGILFTIGISLFLYRGFSLKENIVLNIAGILAVCVALIPMNWGNSAESAGFSIHGICALLFFVCIAYVCFYCATDTLYLIEDAVRRQKFSKTYKILGVGMLISPLIALIFTLIIQQFKSYTFVAEATGVWIFGTYWFIKSRELSITEAEKKYTIEQNEN